MEELTDVSRRLKALSAREIEAVAVRAGLPPSTVRAIATGQTRYPRIDTWKKIVDALPPEGTP